MDAQAASKTDLMGETSAIRTEPASEASSIRAELERVEHKLDMKIADVKSGLRLVESGLRADIRQIEQRMTIKLGGMIVVAVGVLIAAMRFFTLH